MCIYTYAQAQFGAIYICRARFIVETDQRLAVVFFGRELAQAWWDQRGWKEVCTCFGMTCVFVRVYLIVLFIVFRSHCNTLQLTALHCNTLQHATTRCNTLFGVRVGVCTSYMHTCVYVYITIYIHVCMYISRMMCVFVCVSCMYTCVYVYITMCIDRCVYVYTTNNLRDCMCILYMYTCVYVHITMYMHACMHVPRLMRVLVCVYHICTSVYVYISLCV